MFDSGTFAILPRNPLDTRISPEIRPLSLRKRIRCLYRFRPSCADFNLTVHDSEKLLIPDRLARGATKNRSEGSDFIEKASVKHGIESLLNQIV
jgi:hypothetical protein